MGTGTFLAHGHFGSSDAKFYGVELDSITGRISKQLYQRANIQVTGYENALLPDNYFDCVMGKVPFGNFQVNDPQYNRLHFPIHDYFFAKSIFPKFSARKPNAPKAKALAKAAGAAAATACKRRVVNCVCPMKSAVCVTMSACC